MWCSCVAAMRQCPQHCIAAVTHRFLSCASSGEFSVRISRSLSAALHLLPHRGCSGGGSGSGGSGCSGGGSSGSRRRWRGPNQARAPCIARWDAGNHPTDITSKLVTSNLQCVVLSTCCFVTMTWPSTSVCSSYSCSRVFVEMHLKIWTMASCPNIASAAKTDSLD